MVMHDQGGNGPAQDQAPANADVMLVEDQYLIGMQLKMAVERLGYNVAGPFASSEDAIAYLAENKQTPRCAFLDVNLSGETSLAVAKALKQRHIRFCFLTGYASKALPEEAIGIAPVLHKPLQPDQLRERLDEMSKA